MILIRQLVKVDSLKVYRGTAEVLKSVSFCVNGGEVYSLLGGNGAGKSTTLQVCLGLIRPDFGTIDINGIDPAVKPDVARGSMSYLPENVALYEHLNSVENIRYFLDVSADQRTDEQIHEALDKVGLNPKLRSLRLGKYSKGMKQKTAIALALLRSTPVLLLDEPTSGLDPAAASDLSQLLVQLKTSGIAILMVTHDLLGATKIADRIGLLSKGVIAKEWVASEGSEQFDIKELYRAFSMETA